MASLPLFHIAISKNPTPLLPCSIFPKYKANGYLIRPRDQPALSTIVTANILSFGYFKNVDFGVEIINSTTESVSLSFRFTLTIATHIFIGHHDGCDDNHKHDGFGRHDFIRYYLFVTDFQHFVAPGNGARCAPPSARHVGKAFDRMGDRLCGAQAAAWVVL